MIYSLHDPINGGFRYYEAPGQVPINDDHPTPVFSVETPLGIPSTLAGRPMPAQGLRRGVGSEARGSIVSQYASRSSGSPDAVAKPGSGIPSGIGGVFEGASRWWAGSPMSLVTSGLGYLVGGAIVGLVIYTTVVSPSKSGHKKEH